MKNALITALALTGFSLPTLPMAADLDANGDGVMTIEEVQVMFPDVTAEAFSAMDTDSDGVLSTDEVLAGQDAGLMPEIAS
ncbi:EF hand [Shimia gijangensis]|uniref:EF hand n=1 Tax=Shimia gijangensis TaxID=1470563 RepID=A0A1M6HM59_9RHOB|nr:hypothetical protein [Shimia gijangensis]SHJ23311.1 EF hand [Shimia gijangensis]